MDINYFLIIFAGLGALLFFFVGWIASYKIGQSKIVNAEKFAEKIIADAQKEAETMKKAAMLEAKDEWYKAKVRFEKETQARQLELQRMEKKTTERESNLDRKVDILNKKEREIREKNHSLVQKEKAVRAKDDQLSRLIREQNVKLERIAGLTTDEAKKLLMSNLEARAKQEAAQMIKEIKDKAQQTATKEAKEIITLAIQRCAAEHTVESTVSVVSLPNDEMKGRIIGREGRNIRSFEIATGIDVIVDDTPEAVILSGFDPIRREAARVALEKLILDGRIHPGRIEEVVTKAKQEVEEDIFEAGEQTCYDVGVHGLPPELIRLLGRLKYRTSYGQNVLQHSKEVAYLTGLMAAELELDVHLAKRAGLLHDIGKALDHNVEGTHTSIGYQIAKKYNESPIVLNAIMAHHEDDEPESLVAVLVGAADAISGSRPGARRETLEAYIQRLENLEELADSFSGVEKAYAIQAGREVRVMVQHEKLDDAQAAQLAADIAGKIQTDMEYPGQIKVMVIRETRSVEYAK